jgi:integrase
MRPRKKDRALPHCVYLKHGAYYYVKGGKWTRLGSDLRKALEEHARLVTQPRGGMAKAIEDALPKICRGRSENTVRQYKVAARKLQRIFVEFAPQEVLPKDVAKMRRELAGTPNMTNRVLTVLRLVFDCLVEEQIVDSNPCVGVRRLEEASRERLIEHSEFQRIRAHAPPRMQHIMDIAYLSAQRIMDVASLPLSKILAEGVEFKAQKTGKRLIVNWTPELREAIDRAKALHNPKAVVQPTTLFFTPTMQAPSYWAVRDQWRRACKAAGVADTTLRDIRAMAATNAEEQGFNPTALLDHTSPQTTKRYLRGRKPKQVDGPSFINRSNDGKTKNEG